MHNLDQQGDQSIGDFLGSLAEQGSQKRHANGLRVLANVGGDSAATRRRKRQRIKALLHLRREACHDDRIDLRFIGHKPCLNQRRDVIWGFDPTGAALSANEFTQPFRMLFMGKDLGTEPVQQGFFIIAMELSQLTHLPGLRPVGFNGSPIPEVLGKERNIHPHLSREKAQHLWGHLLPRPGKRPS
jgi:hypothetical protein